MKAKNPGPISSESDAKEKLIAYVYEYLTHSGAKRAAQAFLEDIQYEKEIQFNSLEGPGFLVNWWCVFWDLYCAAPETKRNQPEPTSEARAFHEYNMRPLMSPHQTSPPQVGPPFMGAAGGPMSMVGPRYGPPPPPHPGGPIRGAGPPPMNVGPPMPRMQGGMGQPMPPQMSGPPHGPPPPPMMGGAGSPRYGPHSGHMTPGSSASSVGPIGSEPGPSPGLANRMTPNHSGSPHTQMGGPPPPGGMPPMSAPPPGQPPMTQGGGGPPPPPMQRGVAGGPGMQPQGGGWPGNFAVNSPADQQCFMPGPPVPSGQQPGDFGSMMMNDGTGAGPNNNVPPNQQQDEYVMPGAYGQQTEQSDSGSEIMKFKDSLENNANESDQTGFSMDFPDAQGKW